MPILDHFTPFHAIFIILDNFGRVLRFQKTENFEILANSLMQDTCISHPKKGCLTNLHTFVFGPTFGALAYDVLSLIFSI